jgi:hypothetical protein
MHGHVRILMTPHHAAPVLGLALIVALSGCASLRSATLTALGIAGPDEVEARRLASAQRAAGLSDEQIERRTAFLTERLDERRLHAAAWKYGWLVVDGAGGIAAAARAATEDGTDQVNQISQAGKGAIGVAYILLNPMPGTAGADPIREMPDATREDKLARLAAAEELLARAADRARDRTSWLLHFGNVFINAAAAAPVLALGDEGQAAQSFGIGVAAGTLQILTQPWEGPSDWADYERFIASDGAGTDISSEEWQIVPHGIGLAVQRRF